MLFLRFALALVATLLPMSAVAADEDVAIWNAQFVKFHADKDDKIFVRLESQQRLNDNLSRLGQFVLRPYVAYQVNDGLQIGGGYAYFRTASNAGPNGFIFEHRLYTEVNARLVDKPGLKVDTRTRLESRQFANIGDNSWRIRSMVQATVPVTESGLGLVFFTEPFLNLNDQPNFRGGFEQTRNFAGVLIPVSKNVDFMTGYMNLYQPRDERDDRMDHVVWLKTFVRF
jgi:hypothetical protein